MDSPPQANGLSAHPERQAVGHTNGGTNGMARKHESKSLQIVFRRSGDLDRDKFRLKEIVELVRDPRGRDQFFIVIKANGKSCRLGFPEEPCSISDRLLGELEKNFRVDVTVENSE